MYTASASGRGQTAEVLLTSGGLGGQSLHVAGLSPHIHISLKARLVSINMFFIVLCFCSLCRGAVQPALRMLLVTHE